MTTAKAYEGDSGDAEPYSVLRHLAYSVYLGRSPAESSFAVLNALTGYFDDSGKEDTTTVQAGGFVSTVSDWLRFQTEWMKVLALPQFGLPYFHMKELRNPKRNSPFYKFKDNQPLQDELLGLLQRVILRFSLEGIGGGVQVAAYNAVNADYLLEERFGPMAVLAGCVAIDRAVRWQHQNSPAWPIQIVFDLDYAHWDKLVMEAKRQNNVTPIPGDDKLLPPLQGADFAAWETHRAHKRMVEWEDSGKTQLVTDFRTTFHKFMSRYGDWWMVLNEEELRNLCKDNGVPRR